MVICCVRNIVRSRGFTYACDNFDCICTSLKPVFHLAIFFFARTKQNWVMMSSEFVAVHFNRIVQYRRIYFCVEVISSTSRTKKNATLRYDMVEMEKGL